MIEAPKEDAMQRPRLDFWRIFGVSFGFFGIQVGFALQSANATRIFQSLGASLDSLPILWIAGPVTGLFVQPIVGYLSDRTWTFLGRRRPFILVGAILTSLSLIVMPNASHLWVAVLTLWLLDASLNTATEPFRAYVADTLRAEQRSLGYAMQGVFIGAGAVIGSALPYVMTSYARDPSAASLAQISLHIRLSFYIGSAAVLISVLWTVLTTREYSPEALASFDHSAETGLASSQTRGGCSTDFKQKARSAMRAGVIWLSGSLILGLLTAFLHLEWQVYALSGMVSAVGLAHLTSGRLIQARKPINFVTDILSDFATMPRTMKRLAVVQTLSWAALFMMWVYATPVVAARQFGSTDVTSVAFNAGADWVGVLFATYNVAAAIYSCALPWITTKIGIRPTHMFNLGIGALGLISFFFVTHPMTLLCSMVCVGIAWASILTLPYVILSNAISSKKMGGYMGIFNVFIVLPQLVVAAVFSSLLRTFFWGQPVFGFIIGGGCWILAAAAMYFVDSTTMDANPVRAADFSV